MDRVERTGEGEAVIVSVIQAVSAYTNTDPRKVPPLHGSVDADALERFVASLDRGAVHFEHVGVPLAVDADGAVEVRGAPRADPPEAEE